MQLEFLRSSCRRSSGHCPTRGLCWGCQAFPAAAVSLCKLSSWESHRISPLFGFFAFQKRELPIPHSILQKCSCSKEPFDPLPAAGVLCLHLRVCRARQIPHLALTAGQFDLTSFSLLSSFSSAGGDVTAKNIWLAENVLEILTEQRYRWDGAGGSFPAVLSAGWWHWMQ